jgi:hypothetical protein
MLNHTSMRVGYLPAQRLCGRSVFGCSSCPMASNQKVLIDCGRFPIPLILKQPHYKSKIGKGGKKRSVGVPAEIIPHNFLRVLRFSVNEFRPVAVNPLDLPNYFRRRLNGIWFELEKGGHAKRELALPEFPW